MQFGEYLEPGYSPKKEQLFIPDDVYAKALDAIVFTCVDIALTKQGKMLLGKRTRDPQPDWWVVGGRMRAGETFAGSAQRLLKNELGLDMTADRLSPFTVFSTAWSRRAFEPFDNGTHSVSVLMTAKISDDEAQKLAFNDEYSDSKWVTLDEILADSKLHPALKQVAQALKEIAA